MSFCSVLRPAMLSSFQFTGVWSATSIETLFLAILQFQTQSSLISLYLCCISETASAEMNGRDQRNWWQKKRRGRCGTLGGVFFIWATTELFFVFFQIYSLPLWWPVKTLLNIMLHLSRIRSPYSAVHVILRHLHSAWVSQFSAWFCAAFQRATLPVWFHSMYVRPTGTGYCSNQDLTCKCIVSLKTTFHCYMK